MAPQPLPPGSRLVIATHNPGKLTELRALLAGYDLTSAGALGLPEPEETAPDFAGNARIKALAAAQGSGLVALADDSGFCVEALNGAPGVHSARWSGPDKDFQTAMVQVLHKLGDHPNRHAWFVCALCLAWPNGKTETFEGRVDGTVAAAPRGTMGFGYDPLFVPVGETRTYAEMTAEEKERDSHRARAFAHMMRFLSPLSDP